MKFKGPKRDPPIVAWVIDKLMHFLPQLAVTFCPPQKRFFIISAYRQTGITLLTLIDTLLQL